MTTRIASLILTVFLILQASADIISIRLNKLEVSISHDEQPFSIAGSKFKDSKKAISLLTYIYQNWSLGERPVLIIKSNTKAMMPGEDFLNKEIKKLSEKLNFRVIYMPPPIGHRPPSETEIERQIAKWNKQTQLNEAK